MSGDDLIFEQEAQEHAAQEICVRTEILTRCEECSGIFNAGTTDDAQEAYRLGNYLMTNANSLVEVFHQDRKLMTDTIKAVFEDAPAQCTHMDDYERAMAEDD
mgnify:CR=1 FL=1